MDYERIRTADGSDSLRVKSLNETYHSSHGAIQESKHVFIQEGLMSLERVEVPFRIFEVGFGTGLNAVLTWQAATEHDLQVEYYSIEKYPLSKEITEGLNYGEILNAEDKFRQLHQAEWNVPIQMDENFLLTKVKSDLDEIEFESAFDLVYFDAFGPQVQPNMWIVEKLKIVGRALKPGGKMVTYCAQGQFRRNLIGIGLEWRSAPGPPGKREMTIAYKT